MYICYVLYQLYTSLSCCAKMKLHSIFGAKNQAQVHLWYTFHGCCPWSHHSGRCCRGVHRNQQPSWAILRVFVFIHHHSLPHHFWWLNLACRCWYSSPDAVWRCLGSTLPLLCSLTGITVSYQVGKLYGYSVPFYSYEFTWRQVQVLFFFFLWWLRGTFLYRLWICHLLYLDPIKDYRIIMDYPNFPNLPVAADLNLNVANFLMLLISRHIIWLAVLSGDWRPNSHTRDNSSQIHICQRDSSTDGIACIYQHNSALGGHPARIHS